MADTKDSNPLQDAASHRAEAPTAASSGAQQSAQRQSFAATQYWQRVAAAGRAAKSTEEGKQRQVSAQRPSARTRP
jgi:hypothetical protein